MFGNVFSSKILLEKILVSEESLVQHLPQTTTPKPTQSDLGYPQHHGQQEIFRAAMIHQNRIDPPQWRFYELVPILQLYRFIPLQDFFILTFNRYRSHSNQIRTKQIDNYRALVIHPTLSSSHLPENPLQKKFNF